MDVMVKLDETASISASIARVSSVASRDTYEHLSRDVVTLYGVPTPESLALALAATLEARKVATDGATASRNITVSETSGAVGDTAWRDRATGELIRRELSIPFTVLRETAADLLAEGGQGIRRLLAGLLMPDWPEGTQRALTFQLATAGAPRTSDMLAELREADADNFSDDD